MKLLFADQMKKVDRDSAELHSISTLSLMMTAGEKAACLARRILREKRLSRVVAICGKGNNGGDGLAAVLHLTRSGLEAKALFLTPRESLKGDPAAVFEMAIKDHVEVEFLDSPRELASALGAPSGPDLIIDSLFGTGFHPPAGEPWASAMEIMNSSGKPILSIDLPSGLDADTGYIVGSPIGATWTITLGAPKPALFITPSREKAGHVIVADIGHPRELIESEIHQTMLIDASWVREVLTPRKADTHKGTYGQTLIVAGSRLMPGAALLCVLGAHRSGAGLVTLAMPGDLAHLMVPAFPEVIPVGLPASNTGAISRDAVETILDHTLNKDSLVIGPGLSCEEGTALAVREVIGKCPLPAVLDADSLNILADDPRILSERTYPTVITPHPGELSRLTGTSAKNIQARRLESALDAAERFNTITVLKGAGTIVAVPKDGFLVNITGNPGMSSGGMGDVLAGLIGGWLAQGFSLQHASGLGVYLHGLAADLVSREVGPFGFTAREVADRITEAVRIVLEGHDDIERL